MSLVLVDVKENATPTLLKESAAAKYLGICKPYFMEQVEAGRIPFVSLPGRNTRLYDRDDLDSFRKSLKKTTMGARENPPLVALKGAAK
jgi:excisionase family DNA binding protein